MIFTGQRENMTDWYHDPQYVPTKVTALSENQAAVCLRDAFSKLIGKTPKAMSVAILWAQCALETGRFHKINNNNYGNIKKAHKPDDGHNFCMFATGENIYNPVTKKTEWKWFNPPDPQTHFVSNDTMQAGAEHYIGFLSKRTRYARAWQTMLYGNSQNYVHELKNAGYFTADEASYTKGVTSLINYFMQNATKLLKDLTPESAQVTQSTELFSEDDKNHILSLISLTNDMSIEDYFRCSNNQSEESCA